MRHRERAINQSRVVPIFGGTEKEVMDDDISYPTANAWKPMSKSKVSITSVSPGHYSYMWYDPWSKKWFGPVNVWSGSSLDGPVGFIGNTSPPNFPKLDLQYGNIWKSIEQYGKSDVNIGVFLGELRETVRMFHKPWRLAADIVSGKISIPKRVKTIKGLLEASGNQYLGYRYGWRPFLNDVKGFTRLSSRLDQSYRADLARKPMTLKVNSEVSDAATSSGRSSYAPGPAYQVDWCNTATVTIKRCEWCLVSKNPSLQSRSVASQFASTMHLGDIGSIAWELMPYSFIVDWFLPIGDTIAAATDSPANIVAASQPWQWTETKERVDIVNTGYGSSSWISNITFGYSVESIGFARSALGSFPPKPANIDGFQKLDLAMIVGQRLGGLFGKSFRR